MIQQTHAVSVGSGVWVGVSHFWGGDEHGSRVCCQLGFWFLCDQLADASDLHFHAVTFLVSPNQRASRGHKDGWEEARARVCGGWRCVLGVVVHDCRPFPGECVAVSPGFAAGCGRPTCGLCNAM